MKTPGQFFDNFILGVTGSRVDIDSRELNAAAAYQLCRNATHTIHILSRNLDTMVFNHDPIVETLSQFVIGNSKARLKILIFDSDAVVKYGHRLLSLAQKVPSKVEIRVLSNETTWKNESMILADRTGYLFNPKSDRYEGEVDFCDANRNTELNRVFTEYWDRSELDNNLRRLSL